MCSSVTHFYYFYWQKSLRYSLFPLFSITIPISSPVFSVSFILPHFASLAQSFSLPVLHSYVISLREHLDLNPEPYALLASLSRSFLTHETTQMFKHARRHAHTCTHSLKVPQSQGFTRQINARGLDDLNVTAVSFPGLQPTHTHTLWLSPHIGQCYFLLLWKREWWTLL